MAVQRTLRTLAFAGLTTLLVASAIPQATAATAKSKDSGKSAAVVQLIPQKATPLVKKPAKKRGTKQRVVRPQKPKPPKRSTVDCRKVRCVALTYDDGPAKPTGRLLNILRKERVPATFYVLGSAVRANPGLVRRMVREGHEVGNHTYRHPQLTKLSNAKIRREIARTDRAIWAAAKIRPATMRPPYGDRNRRTDRVVNRPVILWDVDTMDWKYRNTKSIMRRLRRSVRPGSIVLLHDMHRSSVTATPSVIRYLKARGYHFVTVSHLLKTQKLRAGRVYAHGPRGKARYQRPEAPKVPKVTTKTSKRVK